MIRCLHLTIILLALLPLASCERMMKNMYDQPRDKAYSTNPLFKDGASLRTPPPGTQAYASGPGAGSSSGRQGSEQIARQVQDDTARTQPYPVDQKLLVRGQERYGIYCLPCHSPIGDGDGRVVRRGFPSPPSYHIARLRNAPDRHIYDVISQGCGAMAPYGDRIPPADRWAIVAFVRALQLSQYARLDELPASISAAARKALAGSPEPREKEQ